jgi:hypothetical protein
MKKKKISQKFKKKLGTKRLHNTRNDSKVRKGIGSGRPCSVLKVSFQTCASSSRVFVLTDYQQSISACAQR